MGTAVSYMLGYLGRAFYFYRESDFQMGEQDGQKKKTIRIIFGYTFSSPAPRPNVIEKQHLYNWHLTCCLRWAVVHQAQISC